MLELLTQHLPQYHLLFFCKKNISCKKYNQKKSSLLKYLFPTAQVRVSTNLP